MGRRNPRGAHPGLARHRCQRRHAAHRRRAQAQEDLPRGQRPVPAQGHDLSLWAARLACRCGLQSAPAPIPMPSSTLSKPQREELLKVLQRRFEAHPARHPGLGWASVQTRLLSNARALKSLHELDSRGVCYSPEGQKRREKEGLQPAGNVLDMAAAMGIELLTEEQYLELQKLGAFDTKSQSWLKTPPEILKLGGALFAERRFGRVFVGANTVPCFYRGRGFRGLRKV